MDPHSESPPGVPARLKWLGAGLVGALLLVVVHLATGGGIPRHYVWRKERGERAAP